MFPSASNISVSSSSTVSNTDWLYNASFKVPVETLDDNENEAKVQRIGDGSKESRVPESGSISEESSDDDIKLIEEIVTVDEGLTKKKKKRKKKKSKHHRDPRDRSRSPSVRTKGREQGKDRREHSPSISELKKLPFGNKVFIEEVGLPPEEAFREDPRPDRNNLAFTSVYYLYVPSYDKKKTFKSRSLTTSLNKAKRGSVLRYYDDPADGNRNQEASSNETFKGCKNIPALPELIPVSGSAFKIIPERSGRLGDSLKGVHDPVTLSYIKAKDISREAVNLNPESGSDLPELEEVTRSKTKDFNELLRNHPHDIGMWFKFLQWQEDLFIWCASEVCTKSREVVLAEKKLSIIEKALESNSNCMRLIMERLNVMRFTATPTELDKEWKRLTFLYPNNPHVWRNYFIFLQTNISYFTVTKITRHFHKYFDIQNSMLEGTFQTHQVTPNLETEILKSVLHYTMILSQAGYQEKAIAVWQILIEFNLFTPEILTLDQPAAQWKVLLEPFWDSGCSRFGEPGAIGWSNVMSTKRLIPGPSRPPIDELEEPLLEQYSTDKVKLWTELELLRGKYFWLPVKGPDADQADDLERNVQLEELTRTLFRFREPSTKPELIIFFLKFLGTIDSSDVLDNLFLTDETSIVPKMSSLFNLRSASAYEGFADFQDQVFVQSIERLKGLPQERQLILLRIKFLIDQVGISLKYKQVKKTIKEYLKLETNRNDLDLWYLLTTLEVKNNDRKEALKIYQTAINMFVGQPQSSPQRLLSFTRRYCELLLTLDRDFNCVNLSYIGSNLKDQEAEATKTVVSVTLGQSIGTLSSNVSTLKAYKVLETMLKGYEDHEENSMDILFCHALLYLLNGQLQESFHLCDNLLEEKLNEPSNQRLVKERKPIFTIYCQLLILNNQRTLCSLSRLRQVCRQALEQFPDHKPFLSLFIEIESNIALPISINSFFTKLIRSTDSSNLVVWLFRLHFELKRLSILKDSSEGSQSFDGLIRRINGLFERCLSFPCNQGIILLWRIFMKFNIIQKPHHDHHDRVKDSPVNSKVKAIVYRAVQHCPWSKTIFLDAIDSLPNLHGDLIKVMNEKGIKLRAPLEEIDLLLAQ